LTNSPERQKREKEKKKKKKKEKRARGCLIVQSETEVMETLERKIDNQVRDAQEGLPLSGSPLTLP
jgi:hypothetical protein